MSEPTLDILDINEEFKKRLRKAGAFYLKDLFVFTVSDLMDILEVDDETATRIQYKASELLEELLPEKYGSLSLKDLEKIEKKKTFLHTGSKNLDKILGGGWASMEVTELAGEFGTGKTQTCYTAIATALLPPEEKGLNTGKIHIMLIDSENVYSKKRLEPIFKRFGIKLKELEEKLIVRKPKHTADQIRIIKSLLPEVREKNIRLIIVDSLTKHPRADFSGRKVLYSRQRAIIWMVERLRRIALIYNLVVLVTNQVVGVPDPFKGTTVRPVGGHVLAHNVDTRLLFRNHRENIKSVKILDSSWLPPAETLIKVTNSGITDPEE
ncbi:MAG: ATPase domain-containing protein [Candidatus Njordarchaeales archaeon]